MLPSAATALELREAFQAEGFGVLRGVFGPREVRRLLVHFMELRARGPWPGDLAGVDPSADDPLLRYPRMIHMHRWDSISLQWLLDPRLREALTVLLGREPLAVQTMLYFKPPGARGQALHQDQHYLRVRGGACVGVWLALDPSDVDNGCMQVVPGTGSLDLLCTEPADTRRSFTDAAVALPRGIEPVPVEMQPGDVLVFGGSVIHGSFPNSSPDRFRRALIGHYVTGAAQAVDSFYQPALRFDGREITLAESPAGGPCGRWVHDGERSVVLVDG